MTETGQDHKIGIAVAKAFYGHALRTIAWALVAFALVGAVFVGTVYQADPDASGGFAIVIFLTWGSFAAAAVFALRRPPL